MSYAFSILSFDAPSFAMCRSVRKKRNIIFLQKKIFFKKMKRKNENMKMMKRYVSIRVGIYRIVFFN